MSPTSPSTSRKLFPRTEPSLGLRRAFHITFCYFKVKIKFFIQLITFQVPSSHMVAAILYNAVTTSFHYHGHFCRTVLLWNKKNLPQNQRDWPQKWNVGYRIAFLYAYKNKLNPHSPKYVNASRHV